MTRLTQKLEAAWSRIEAGARPADALVGFTLTAIERSEIGTRCWLLADRLAGSGNHNAARVEEIASYLRHPRRRLPA